MFSTDFIKTLKPELIYLQGNAIVPAKALRYKKDPQTSKIIEWIAPNTRKFENTLRKEVEKEIKGVKEFPTKKNIFVILSYGINSYKRYEKSDLDNRAKTILDALEGPVYYDDGQVIMLLTYKELLEGSRESYYRFSLKILDKKLTTRIIKKIKNFQKQAEK